VQIGLDNAGGKVFHEGSPLEGVIMKTTILPQEEKTPSRCQNHD
jgi:hypothetical protein